MQPVSQCTIFPSVRIVWDVRHWIARLEGKDLFCNHLSWLAEGGEDYEGNVVTKPITNCWGTCMLCFCSGSRRKFGTRTIVDRDLGVLKAFAAVGLRSAFLSDVVVSPHPRTTCRESQKNSSPHSRRTRRYIPEEFIATFQMNASLHLRRTLRYFPEEFVAIPEERVNTSQKNSSPHPRRTCQYIPEEFVAAS